MEVKKAIQEPLTVKRIVPLIKNEVATSAMNFSIKNSSSVQENVRIFSGSTFERQSILQLNVNQQQKKSLEKPINNFRRSKNSTQSKGTEQIFSKLASVKNIDGETHPDHLGLRNITIAM